MTVTNNPLTSSTYWPKSICSAWTPLPLGTASRGFIEGERFTLGGCPGIKISACTGALLLLPASSALQCFSSGEPYLMFDSATDSQWLRRRTHRKAEFRFPYETRYCSILLTTNNRKPLIAGTLYNFAYLALTWLVGFNITYQSFEEAYQKHSSQRCPLS